MATDILNRLEIESKTQATPQDSDSLNILVQPGLDQNQVLIRWVLLVLVRSGPGLVRWVLLVLVRPGPGLVRWVLLVLVRPDPGLVRWVLLVLARPEPGPDQMGPSSTG